MFDYSYNKLRNLQTSIGNYQGPYIRVDGWEFKDVRAEPAGHKGLPQGLRVWDLEFRVYTYRD